ncbi:MATE family efflux transporter [Endozoicomonas gorgoniicola]|uniref:Multidrug export protein MepA n=1 Tax=Endozoicomonas gorgoniicola TaxID=1234144 RepID=A0ABT3MYE1_9GAMM|nr:MATE family efflux transporter [Endozoicomonas gorgoniicola]MCW7554390.1 MATE family efflux transporter [Endozoicomonas gorgoniicola]
MSQLNRLGNAPIGKLLMNMTLPACSGILVLMMYNIIDTIIVGQYAGAMAIAGMSVVLPVSMLIPTLGMGIGVGSSSIISRSLGAKDLETARLAFGNALSLAALICTTVSVLSGIYATEILSVFGGRGEILPYAMEYYTIILMGIPILGCWMCMNNTLRAEGLTKYSVIGMCLSSAINLILDIVFVIFMDMGLKGAAIATVLSQIAGLVYLLSFYLRGGSQLKIKRQYFRWDKAIIRETLSLGASTIGRQGAASVMVILLNQSLYLYGGPIAVAVYGILHRIISLLFVPIIGMTQGFLPIAGYNYGARQYDRVLAVVYKSILFGTIVSGALAVLAWSFPETLIQLFTSDETVLELGVQGLKTITVLMPLAAAQNIAAGYFQAIGKPVAAFILTLSRQVLILIPMLYLLPQVFELKGVWLAFPVSDVLACILTLTVFARELPKLKKVQHKAALQAA